MSRNRGYPTFPLQFSGVSSKNNFPVEPLEMLPKADSVFDYAGAFDLSGPFPTITLQSTPDYYAWFVANRYYNCIEIDAIYSRQDHGWNVPDLFKLALDKQDKIFGVNSLVSGFYADPSVPRITYQFGSNSVEYIKSEDWQFIFQPAKTYFSPTGAGDLTNTSTLYGKQVFRIYGAKPFRAFALGQWSQYKASHTIETTPELSFRVWYDPKQTILRSVT